MNADYKHCVLTALCMLVTIQHGGGGNTNFQDYFKDFQIQKGICFPFFFVVVVHFQLDKDLSRQS